MYLFIFQKNQIMQKTLLFILFSLIDFTINQILWIIVNLVDFKNKDTNICFC